MNQLTKDEIRSMNVEFDGDFFNGRGCITRIF